MRGRPDLGWGHSSVCVGHYDDGIVSVSVHHNMSDSSPESRPGDRCKVNVRIREDAEQVVAEAVVANRPNERHLSSCPGSSHGLVESLAPSEDLECRPSDGFSDQRMPISEGHQVSIETPNNANVPHPKRLPNHPTQVRAYVRASPGLADTYARTRERISIVESPTDSLRFCLHRRRGVL